MSGRKPYRSDLSDGEWAVIEPELSAWRTPRLERKVSADSQPVHELREIVNAILYVNRTGCAWEYLPHDFPPFKTVYGYFAAWRDDGTTERIHDLLRRRLRRARGRSEEPSAVAVDSQTVKASGSAAPDTVGFDGNKKTRGRKRHIAVDTLGLLIVLGVSAASLADSPVGRQVLTRVAAVAPTVTKAWVDGGYNQKVVEHGAELGIDVEVVRREPGAGFKVLPRRWVVERTFGWFMLHRRLVRDYETRQESSRTMIHWSIIGVMGRALTRTSTPSWQDPARTAT
jgi:transposase